MSQCDRLCKPTLAIQESFGRAADPDTSLHMKHNCSDPGFPGGTGGQKQICLKVNSYTAGLLAAHFASAAANWPSGEGACAAVATAHSASSATVTDTFL